MKIIQPRTQVQIVEYRKVFKVIGLLGSSMSFECDQNGVVDTQKLGECAQDSYRQCLKGEIRLSTGTYLVDTPIVEDNSRSYWQAAVGACDNCGEDVYLEGFTNVCDGCQTDYNMSGQSLRPREEWIEPGSDETLQDILSIDNYDPEDLL